MRGPQNAKPKSEQAHGSNSVGARRRVLPLIVILLFSFCALFALLIGKRASAETDEITKGPQMASLETALFKPAQDYSKFSHSSPGAHAASLFRLACQVCHTRRGNSIEPTFPEHKDCTKCHQTQFNTPGSPICSICHNPADLSQQKPPTKNFPNNLNGFNTIFDHAPHLTVVAPPQRCTLCHSPARGGVAQTIPANMNAHQTCYGCHTPGKQARGLDISSCGTCHVPGRYAPTSTSGRSFGIGFSHADHGPRYNLNCESCHTVAGRGGAQGRQVSSTTPAQHFPATRSQTCATCHNNQRSFGEANFIDCKRCHTGPTFRL